MTHTAEWFKQVSCHGDTLFAQLEQLDGHFRELLFILEVTWWQCFDFGKNNQMTISHIHKPGTG